MCCCGAMRPAISAMCIAPPCSRCRTTSLTAQSLMVTNRKKRQVDDFPTAEELERSGCVYRVCELRLMAQSLRLCLPAAAGSGAAADTPVAPNFTDLAKALDSRVLRHSKQVAKRMGVMWKSLVRGEPAYEDEAEEADGAGAAAAPAAGAHGGGRGSKRRLDRGE